MTLRYQVAEEGGGYRLTDGVARASARITPALGNNVLEWRVQPEGFDAPIDVYLPPAEPGAVGAGGYGAGNPILFPFPNRVREGKYSFDGQTLQLDINEPGRNNHIHGLVARAPWQTESAGADPERGAWHRAGVDLEALPDVPRQYPFPCRLSVLTRLVDGALVQDVRVRNTGTGRLPMGFGTHPWFPATIGDAPRAASEVRVPGRRYWHLEGLVPVGRTVEVETAPAGWLERGGDSLSRRRAGAAGGGQPGLPRVGDLRPDRAPGGLPRAVHRDDGRRESARPGGGRRPGRARARRGVGGDDSHLVAPNRALIRRRG